MLTASRSAIHNRSSERHEAPWHACRFGAPIGGPFHWISQSLRDVGVRACGFDGSSIRRTCPKRRALVETVTMNASQPDPGGLIDYPPGNSAQEIAARRGFGPLSARGREVWHGDSLPCVSCGQLVRRPAATCTDCGEDLSAGMIERMRAYAGPWYVLEHVRPFPGVTHERLIRQIRRGVLTGTTIVRGPTTDHQWRFAAETPGLSKHLGVCWNCHSRVSTEDSVCVGCGSALGELTDGASGKPVSTGEVAFRPDAAAISSSGGGAASGGIAAVEAQDVVHRSRPPGASVPRLPSPIPESHAIRELQTAVRTFPRTTAPEVDPPRLGSVRASWITAGIVVAFVAVLLVVVGARESGRASDRESSGSIPRGSRGG